MRVPEFYCKQRARLTRVALPALLMLGLAMLLAQVQTGWAQPHQNELRDTINTPVASPTVGPSSTPIPSPAGGVQRLLLREGLNDYDGTRDTWINSFVARVPQALDGGLKLKGGDQAILARFELDGWLPAGATVVDAELRFYVDIPAFTVARSLDVAAYRVLREWEEDEAAWKYVNANNSTQWDTEGCSGIGVDRVGEADETLTFFHRGVYRGFDVTKSVQYWQEHPEENYGWLVRGVSASTGTFSLPSSRSSVYDQRPLLRIDYTLGDVTPTVTVTPGGPTATATSTFEATLTPTQTETPSATPEPVETVLQASQDAYIDSWYPTDPHDLETLYCRNGGIRKPLVQFDLSELPERAHVTSAQLRLMATDTSGSTISVTAYRLLREWAEEEATWVNAEDGALWHTEGAAGAGADYAPTPLDTTVVDAAATAYLWDVTAAAQAWVQGGEQNHGLLLVAANGPQVQRAFRAIESRMSGAMPQLIVNYYIAEPAATPTPTATATPESGDIHVFVFDDLDRDGWPDSGEQGIYGVTVSLLAYADKQVLNQEVTDVYGECVFGDVTPGQYRLMELDPDGYASSTSNEVAIWVGSGTVDAWFGDYETGGEGALALPYIVND